MNRAWLFVVGILVGTGAHAIGGRQQVIVGLNHVAIRVPDVDAASRLYTDTLGFPVAFAFRDADGRATMEYLQISRNTFIELQRATEERPAGLDHFGLEVTDVNAVVRMLRAGGVAVPDATVSPRTKTRLTMAHAPSGVNIELLEFGPDSLHRKVIEAWRYRGE